MKRIAFHVDILWSPKETYVGVVLNTVDGLCPSHCKDTESFIRRHDSLSVPLSVNSREDTYGVRNACLEGGNCLNPTPTWICGHDYKKNA